MFVLGVNHEKYDQLLKVVSNASCITSCLDPPDQNNSWRLWPGDFNSSFQFSTFNTGAGIAFNDNFIRLISDNEYGYIKRVVELMVYIA